MIQTNNVKNINWQIFIAYYLLTSIYSLCYFPFLSNHNLEFHLFHFLNMKYLFMSNAYFKCKFFFNVTCDRKEVLQISVYHCCYTKAHNSFLQVLYFEVFCKSPAAYFKRTKSEIIIYSIFLIRLGCWSVDLIRSAIPLISRAQMKYRYSTTEMDWIII